MPNLSSNPVNANNLPTLTPPSQLRRPPATGTGALPVNNNPVSSSTLTNPDQLKQQMQSKQPVVAPSISLVPNDPKPNLQSSVGQLQALMQNADQSALTQYGVQMIKNPQGQIMGYTLNGQPATAEQVQQHLLPTAGFLHTQLEKTKTQVTGEYQSFVQNLNNQFASMNPQEQSAVRIQVQAINVIYQSFLNRINQVDELIK